MRTHHLLCKNSQTTESNWYQSFKWGRNDFFHTWNSLKTNLEISDLSDLTENWGTVNSVIISRLLSVILTKCALLFVKNKNKKQKKQKKKCKTATPFLTKWAVSFSPCIVEDCVWLFSLSWLVKKYIYIYIYRTFLVTLALRHVTKLNHGRRKFAAHFRIFKFHVQVMPGLCIRFSYSVFLKSKGGDSSRYFLF